jgi:hypothetical protein
MRTRASILSLLFACLTVSACGGGVGTDVVGNNFNAKALCNHYCDKLGTCFSSVPQIASQCHSGCDGAQYSTVGKTCSNADAYASCIDDCLSKDCNTLAQCFSTCPVPSCR